MKNVIQIACHV